MSQILHIFKKDTRHLWPEILISLALTAAFVRVSFGGLSDVNGTASPYLPIFADLLSVLVPVGWWVLVVRLVHDESLVGENQFWITRPYRWDKLLAAKCLFLVVFLNLPIFTAQVILLVAAGFNPLAYLPGLFYNLILITCVFILPISAIATITSNFSRFVLALLSAVVYVVFIGWVTTPLYPAEQFSFANSYESKLIFSLISLIFLLVIGLQYATRHTWRSRWLLLALPFVALVCNLAWPIQTITRHLYPSLAAVEPSPVQLDFDPDPERQNTISASHQATRIDLYLPLTISGISSGALVSNQAVQVNVEAPNGMRWNSKWQNVSNYFQPDTSRSFIDVPIDQKVLDRIEATPVTVTLSFALVQLRADATVTSQAGDQNFSVPGGGICSVLSIPGAFPECRFAMRGPALTFVTARWTARPCSQPQPSTDSGVLGNVWLGTVDPDPAEFGLDPVKVKPLLFSNRPGDTRGSGFICPGASVTATPYSVVRRLTTTLTIPNLDLTKYTVDHLDRTRKSTRLTFTVR